jgi:hypothetical protein
MYSYSINKMKFSRTHLAIALAIFLLIVVSLCCAPGVAPYSPSEIFAKQFKYEGFTSLGYSSNVDNSAMDTKTSYLINGDTGDCKKVYGFDGLFCKPYVADVNKDPFSGTKGSPAAFGASSGLSNSTGSLVLSAEQVTLLKTRGGNQTGKPAEIGSK